jgi:hypothetical protein
MGETQHAGCGRTSFAQRAPRFGLRAEPAARRRQFEPHVYAGLIKDFDLKFKMWKCAPLSPRSEAALRLQFELHVYAGLRARESEG